MSAPRQEHADARAKPRRRVGGGRRYSRERFAAVAVTMLQGGIEPRFLWEAMFQADMEAYRLTGKSITGATWLKTWRGVEPKRPKPSKTSASASADAPDSAGGAGVVSDR